MGSFIVQTRSALCFAKQRSRRARTSLGLSVNRWGRIVWPSALVSKTGIPQGIVSSNLTPTACKKCARGSIGQSTRFRILRLEVQVLSGTPVMTKEGGSDEYGYTDYLNTTPDGCGPDEERRFFVYQIRRYPDGEVVKRQIGCIDCTKPQMECLLKLAIPRWKLVFDLLKIK